ncbi:MAG: TonB-dependent receptor, partial [Candidatus Omnitrophica bacterium]|nr:TonB-dependent receptor [Candidatus Omnitrophota bacterium]
AAIFVMDEEDIRRTGASSIPELLRFVPGVNVAQIDSNKWAISSRGFNNDFANKLLVLIDGRTVYTPLFSGVYWDVQDVLIEDIERVEVIRGPGAVVWGANAVNGVINIITKDAEETQGGLVTGTWGSEEDILGLRQGWQLDNGAFIRLWGKLKEIDSLKTPDDLDAGDRWNMERGGFRIDYDLNDEEKLILDGMIYNGDLNDRVLRFDFDQPSIVTRPNDINVSGGNLSLRWEKITDSGEAAWFQAYYDRTERDSKGVFREFRDTFDLDFTQTFELGDRQEITWGLGYRYTSDDTKGTFYASVSPRSRSDNLFSAFIQDAFELEEDVLELTLGSKFEHNDYTGFEIQPSARLAYTPDADRTTWLSVSRAVRTPSRFEQDGDVAIPSIAGVDPESGLPVISRILGNEDFDSEELIAYEAGHRVRINECMEIDVAGFFNDYDNLRSNDMGLLSRDMDPQPHLVTPLRFGNRVEGNTYGVETFLDYQARANWRLMLGYSYIHFDMKEGAEVGDPFGDLIEGYSPSHQLTLRSYYDLPCNMEFDTSLQAVSDLSTIDIPGYVRLDTRLGWNPNSRTEISLGFQNILDDRHPEFQSFLFTPVTEIQHSVYGKIVYRF